MSNVNTHRSIIGGTVHFADVRAVAVVLHRGLDGESGWCITRPLRFCGRDTRHKGLMPGVTNVARYTEPFRSNSLQSLALGHFSAWCKGQIRPPPTEKLWLVSAVSYPSGIQSRILDILSGSAWWG